MCYIDNNKRETVSGYPDNNIAIILQTAVTMGSSGGYLRMPLKIS